LLIINYLILFHIQIFEIFGILKNYKVVSSNIILYNNVILKNYFFLFKGNAKESFLLQLIDINNRIVWANKRLLIKTAKCQMWFFFNYIALVWKKILTCNYKKHFI